MAKAKLMREPPPEHLRRRDIYSEEHGNILSGDLHLIKRDDFDFKKLQCRKVVPKGEYTEDGELPGGMRDFFGNPYRITQVESGYFVLGNGEVVLMMFLEYTELSYAEPMYRRCPVIRLLAADEWELSSDEPLYYWSAPLSSREKAKLAKLEVTAEDLQKTLSLKGLGPCMHSWLSAELLEKESQNASRQFSPWHSRCSSPVGEGCTSKSPSLCGSPRPFPPPSPELKAAPALEADCHESKGAAVAFGVNGFESGSKRPREWD